MAFKKNLLSVLNSPDAGEYSGFGDQYHATRAPKKFHTIKMAIVHTTIKQHSENKYAVKSAPCSWASL